MTPMAFDLLQAFTTPGGFALEVPADYDRRIMHKLGPRTDEGYRKLIWRMVQRAKFFDMTAVAPLILDIAEKMLTTYDSRNLFKTRLAFLPAPETWLEMTVGGERITCVLFSADASTSTGDADVIVLTRNERAWNLHMCTKMPLVHSAERPERSDLQLPIHDKRWWTGEWTHRQIDHNKNVQHDQPQSSWAHFVCYAALSLINTPRVIGRRQHMPHERVEREKLKQLKLVGKFPLRAWTEILLTVAPPDDRTGQPSTEAHLTGEKCLHFCRTHLRVRLGQLEYIEAHWRGNPALGMKRSRYRLAEPNP